MFPVFLRCRQAAARARAIACATARAALLVAACLATANALAVPAIEPLRVAPDVYYVQGIPALGSRENQNFISNAGFVVTQDSVVMIDALGSPAAAERMVAEIRKITPKPISHVILTHYHADHIYGLQVFKALGAQVVAHALGKDYLNSDTARLRLEASRKDLAPWIDETTKLVPADVWLDGRTEMTIGGTRFVIQPAGPAHTPEDLAIYLPRQKVMFAGDIVFRNRIPYVGTADSRHWIASLDTLLSLDVRTIVPGHGPASDEPKQDLQQTR
ncbi:MBL fold metallo-hydrolase, partial [Variovorax sp. KBW07]|uniref:MBL fold metallo-hydrolase n=1 Tax=Variovorax sp. KBW07 TaxID=2153358 RepID=UPI000FC102A7